MVNATRPISARLRARQTLGSPTRAAAKTALDEMIATDETQKRSTWSLNLTST